VCQRRLPSITTNFRCLSTTTTTSSKNWADPVARQYKYWNREKDAGRGGQYSYLIDMSPESIVQEARIISLSDPEDVANAKLHSAAPGGGGSLPSGASLVAIGTKLQDFQHLSENDQPNVLFVSPSCPHSATVLPEVLRHFPSIRWVHVRSAGIDFVESEEFAAMDHLVVTNAKGQFSSSLAEYALMACSYFAKDLPRIMRQKEARLWEKYDIEELYVFRVTA
jgi:hypothetical protein